MERKNLTAILKADDAAGSVKAVFATLDVIDKDGDVIQRGSFDEERVNIAAWGHNWADLPAGDGLIKEHNNEAIFEGDFYLGTPQGDATYQTLKQRHERGFTQEWSFGFDVLEAEPGIVDGKDVRLIKKLKVYEVSPVMVGAGVDTRTLAMKSLDEEADTVVSALKAFVKRMSDRAAFRKEHGRGLSAANLAQLTSVSEELTALMAANDSGNESEEPNESFTLADIANAEIVEVEESSNPELPDDAKQLLARHLALQERYAVL